MLHYIRVGYFGYLRSNGLHILHTVPIWKQNFRNSYALTDVAFHVYSKTDIKLDNWAQVPPQFEPSIVVLGMTGGRKMPSFRLSYSAQWASHASKNLGMICIAKRLFLDDQLLKTLAKINAGVTIIPVSSSVDNGKWDVHLQTFAQGHPDKPSDFKHISRHSDKLVLNWQHRDDYIYEHDGNSPLINSRYTLLCE